MSKRHWGFSVLGRTAGWEVVALSDIRAGDEIRTIDHTTGEVIAQGVVDSVSCPKETRFLDADGEIIARSDYPCIERRRSW